MVSLTIVFSTLLATEAIFKRNHYEQKQQIVLLQLLVKTGVF